MGWSMARECAEVTLNMIRMVFGFARTDRMRLAGNFHASNNLSSLVLKLDGEASLATGTGSMPSVLEDSWQLEFFRCLGPYATLVSSFISWLAAGTHAGNPIIERLRYANVLLAEAYCEPSDLIRLVRLTSALEAVALLEGRDKAHNLAVRCASVGGCGIGRDAVQIYDAVKQAYALRNAVVHGDAPQVSDVRMAFSSLEAHVLRIFVGFLTIFSEIHSDVRPQSVRTLRREFNSRFEQFFFEFEQT